ncbi:hypothetical protein YC2023_118302 [Brassica napus]
MGLQQAVALCMDHCDAAELTGDGSWFKTVVLAGGSACLPGLAVIPPCGVDTAWHGGKLISNLCKDRAIPSVRDGQVAAACN